MALHPDALLAWPLGYLCPMDLRRLDKHSGPLFETAPHQDHLEREGEPALLSSRGDPGEPFEALIGVRRDPRFDAAQAFTVQAIMRAKGDLKAAAGHA